MYLTLLYARYCIRAPIPVRTYITGSAFVTTRDGGAAGLRRTATDDNSPHHFINGLVADKTRVKVMSEKASSTGTPFVKVEVESREGFIEQVHLQRAAVPTESRGNVKRKAKDSSSESNSDDSDCPLGFGSTVHIPAITFPEDTPPNGVYWEATVCAKDEDGRRRLSGHVWLDVPGDPQMFSRTFEEVEGWSL